MGAMALPLSSSPSRDLVSHYVRRARSENTLRTYAAQWQQFATWCSQSMMSPMPADPELVARYLAERAQAGSTVSSIHVGVAAIAFAHAKNGFVFARENPTLTLVLAGIRREHTYRTQQAQ